MLTLFTTPKPFRGHIGVIQRNAITSWTLLDPRPEIILFGNDEGTEEAAKDFGVRYVPNVVRNEFGTPSINDLFEKAERLASHDFLCYLNADIILMSGFMQSVERVVHLERRFLMVGQRWDVEVHEALQFDSQWENRLREHVAQSGQLHSVTGLDYFVFARNLWGEIPPFAIGRTAWDNWLLYRARSQGAAVVDATPVVMAVHQNHDWSHIPSGRAWAWEGPEAKRNLALAGGWDHIFTLWDATHLLTLERLRLTFDLQHVRRHLHVLPILYPSVRWLVWLPLRILQISHRLRARLHLTLSSGDDRHA